MKTEQIKSTVEKYHNYIVEMRREFHRYPEVSGKEQHTREILVRELEKMGVPYRLLPGTGLIGFVEGVKPGKHRVVRADIDALPITEAKENLKREKVCISEKPGVCHACGHDAHMAMLLGTMKVLVEIKEELEGTVYCCFEEAEEDITGVAAMMEALKDYPIDECFALHVYSGLEAGKIDISAGARMAGTAGIGFYLNGKSGHSSRPDQAINPIIPAAHIITQLNSAFMNQIDAEKTVTLSICMMNGGTADNVIPERVYVGGTARFFDREEGEKAQRIINKITENTAACHNCTVDFQPRNHIMVYPVINDAAVAESVRDAVSELCREQVIGSCDHWYASESYSRYLEQYPGALGFLGIHNEEYGSGAAHHNEKFDVDENVLPLGVCAELAFLLR